MVTDSEERTWYLRDEPLEHLDEEDKLHHKGYVRILLDIIEEMTPPFTLGIFGGWGVGKTSIVRDMLSSAKQDKELAETLIVHLDIWKYEGDSLRRQFLLDMQDELKNQGSLDKQFFVEPELYTSRTEEGQTEPRFSKRRLKEVWPLLLEVFAISIAGIFLISLLEIKSQFQILISALLIPLLLYLIPRLSRVVVVQKKYSISEAALYSSEQFEKVFKKMISDTNCKCNKIVIVIDNLDRCCRSRVVEVLSVIKTYLEPIGENKCIFIIPCDNSAIKEQIKAEYKISPQDSSDAEEYADEYIRKFFNASISITPFIEKEIEPYIETLLSKILLTQDMDVRETKQLTQMISSVFRKNPRQIKQFLNNLTSKYLLIKEREAGTEPLIQPIISDNILFLAKVAIIETKFSNWYRQFEADDNLYGEVTRSLYTPDSRINKGDDLWYFLDLTRDITARNHKAFFHLKQNPHEAKIPNYDQFSESVRSGDREKVLEVYESSSNEAKNAQLDELISQIRNNVRKGYIDFVVRAISVSCVIVPKLKPEDKKEFASEIISTIAKHEEVRDKLQSLKTVEVFALMPDANKTDSSKVREKYLELYSKELPEGTVDDDLRVEIAKAIVNNLEPFTRSQLKEVRTVTTGFKTVSPELLLTISSSKEAIQAFVEPSLVAKVIDEIEEDDIKSFVQTEQAPSEHEPHIEFIIRCPDYVSGEIATSWIQKLASLLEASVNKNPQLEDYILRCTDDSHEYCQKADNSAVDQLAQYINQRYPNVDAEDRIDIMLTLQDIYNNCSTQQASIENRIVSEFIPSEPLNNVIKFIATYSESEFKEIPYIDNVFNHLAIRVVSKDSPENRRLLNVAFDEIGTQVKLSVLTRLLKTIIKRPEINTTIPIIQELVSSVPKHNMGKNLVKPILIETIHPSRGTIPTQEQKALLKLAIKMKEWHTNDFRTELEVVITESLCSDNPSNRQLGLEILNEAYHESIISENNYINILRKMSLSLIESRPAPDESIIQQLNVVTKNKQRVITSEMLPGFVEYLRQLILPQIPANYRQQILSYLSAFVGIPLDILQEVIPELVGYAEQEGNQNVRISIEECLLSLRAQNRPLDRDLWEDLYRYVRATMASPEEVQKERGNELSKRMRQITMEAKKAAGITELNNDEESESKQS